MKRPKLTILTAYRSGYVTYVGRFVSKNNIRKVLSILLFFCLSVVNGQNIQSFDISYHKTPELELPLDQLIYFVGETHNISSNELLDYSFITLLNQSIGLNALIKEGGYIYIYFLNEYLKTGDKNIFDNLNKSYYVHEELQFLDSLRQYNSTLQQDKRINIYGIDAVIFFHVEELVNYWMLKHGSSDEKVVNECFNKLKNLKTQNFSFDRTAKEKKIIKKEIKELQQLNNNNREIFKNYLSDDYLHFQMIINNSATLNRVDQTLYDNFLRLRELTESNKFYFSYGRLHAQKKGNWLANKLNKYPEYTNKVLSIKPFYKASQMFWGGKMIDVDNTNEIDSEILQLLKEVNTPYKWHMIKSNNSEFDYVLIGVDQSGIQIIRK